MILASESRALATTGAFRVVHADAAQKNAVLAEPHTFAVWAARQIEITSEHLTRVARISFEWIGRDSSTPLVQLAS